MIKVAFDFDDTLCMINYEINIVTKTLLLEHHENGDEIVIVTARNKDCEVFERPTIADFVKEHDLPVKDIHFTDGLLKGPILNEIGAHVIYDDMIEHLISARRFGIRGFLVDNDIVIEYNGRGRTGKFIRS
jgi:hypothetical protein